MSTITPAQLVEEYKKLGEFDRLQRELFEEFKHSDNIDSFKARIESIAKQRLSKDPEKFRDSELSTVRGDLKKEVDRYPIIERAIGEIPSLRNESVARSVESKVQQILRDLREKQQREEKASESITGQHAKQRQSSEAQHRDASLLEQSMDKEPMPDGPTGNREHNNTVSNNHVLPEQNRPSESILPDLPQAAGDATAQNS